MGKRRRTVSSGTQREFVDYRDGSAVSNGITRRVDAHQQTVDRISNYRGVASAPVHTKSARITGDDWKTIVANPKEAEVKLRSRGCSEATGTRLATRGAAHQDAACLVEESNHAQMVYRLKVRE